MRKKKRLQIVRNTLDTYFILFGQHLYNLSNILGRILMTRQLLIFYWSLVVWIAYVNLKFWIDEVVDLMTCRKDCLFVKVIDNAIAMHLIVYNDNRTLHSKISHCVVLVILTVRHTFLARSWFCWKNLFGSYRCRV